MESHWEFNMSKKYESLKSREISALFHVLKLDNYQEREQFGQLAKLGERETPQERHETVIYTRNNTAEEELISDAQLESTP